MSAAAMFQESAAFTCGQETGKKVIHIVLSSSSCCCRRHVRFSQTTYAANTSFVFGSRYKEKEKIKKKRLKIT
jgi:hypothetical protein